jgi:hypothetical protein
MYSVYIYLIVINISEFEYVAWFLNVRLDTRARWPQIIVRCWHVRCKYIFFSSAHSGGRIGRFSRQVVPTFDMQVRIAAAQYRKHYSVLG